MTLQITIRLPRAALDAAASLARRFPARVSARVRDKDCRRMKNQYFGDINDYRKYGLLRALQSTGDGSLIERSALLPRTRYHTAVVPDGRLERDGWRKDLLRAASGVDLVFLDPDNGIEVPSKPVGRKGSTFWHFPQV